MKSNHDYGDKNNARSVRRNEKVIAIRSVLQSLTKLMKEEDRELNLYENTRAQRSLLLDVMQKLSTATVERDILINMDQTVQSILQLDTKSSIAQTFSYKVLERVMKITAMTGLYKTSIQIFDFMISRDEMGTGKTIHVPSHIAYISLFNVLRQDRALKEMRMVFYNLATACSLVNNHVHTVALNIFIASLCDAAVAKTPMSSRDYKRSMKTTVAKASNIFSIIPDKRGENSHQSPSFMTVQHFNGTPHNAMHDHAPDFYNSDNTFHESNLSSLSLIEEVLALLKPSAHQHWTPNIRSFNTILDIAAKLEDEPIMKQVFTLLDQHNIQYDICTYNAKLRLALTQWKTIKGYQLESMGPVMSIIEDILQSDDLFPDQYTIEMMLLPLSKAGKIDTILQILQDFNTRIGDDTNVQEHERLLSNAYSTFLLALLNGDEMRSARIIFDTFLLNTPSADRSISNPIINAKHFNIMMKGYSDLAKSWKEESMFASNNSNNSSHCRENATDNLFRVEFKRLWDHMMSLNVPEDPYTFSILLEMQNSSSAITNVWTRSSIVSNRRTSALYRSFITAYGRVKDVALACAVFDCMIDENRLQQIYSVNNWNCLLKVLSDACFDDVPCLLDNHISFPGFGMGKIQGRTISNQLHGLTPVEAVATVFAQLLRLSDSNPARALSFQPNSQSYCLMASAYSRGGSRNGDVKKLGIELLRNATSSGIASDGRFLSSVIRCFGDDIHKAIDHWKGEIRVLALAQDDRKKNASSSRKRRGGENLSACYHALCFVAGRANRADIALRLVYAMKKDDLEPTETALNCYKSGKRLNTERLNKLYIIDQYETLLMIECCKYDKNDKRRKKETRLRIIL